MKIDEQCFFLIAGSFQTQLKSRDRLSPIAESRFLDDKRLAYGFAQCVGNRDLFPVDSLPTEPTTTGKDECGAGWKGSGKQSMRSPKRNEKRIKRPFHSTHSSYFILPSILSISKFHSAVQRRFRLHGPL